MLHYNPHHVASSTLLIFRRTNCIITASCIVTLCKRPYSMPVESVLLKMSSKHVKDYNVIYIYVYIYCYRIKEVCIKLVT